MINSAKEKLALNSWARERHVERFGRIRKGHYVQGAHFSHNGEPEYVIVNEDILEEYRVIHQWVLTPTDGAIYQGRYPARLFNGKAKFLAEMRWGQDKRAVRVRG